MCSQRVRELIETSLYDVVISLEHFVSNCDEYAVHMVDNLLDILTDCEHSKTNALLLQVLTNLIFCSEFCAHFYIHVMDYVVALLSVMQCLACRSLWEA